MKSLKRFSSGISNKQVGEALELSERTTVENHRNSAYKKLSVSNLNDLKEDFASFFYCGQDSPALCSLMNQFQGKVKSPRWRGLG